MNTAIVQNNNQVLLKWRTLLQDRTYVMSFFIALAFLCVSTYANFKAVQFAEKDSGSATTDLLLDNIPVVNSDFFFSEGAIIFISFVVVFILLKPGSLPFVVKSLALLLCVRSFFVILTHIAPYPDHIVTDLDAFRYFTTGYDLFFSGHTAIPFMMALLYWKEFIYRVVFLSATVVAAVAVILGHLHYSIDVFAAFFIVFGVYCFAKVLFRTDIQRFGTTGLEINL